VMALEFAGRLLMYRRTRPLQDDPSEVEVQDLHRPAPKFVH
jgi:hypothetical protein